MRASSRDRRTRRPTDGSSSGVCQRCFGRGPWCAGCGRAARPRWRRSRCAWPTPSSSFWSPASTRSTSTVSPTRTEWFVLGLLVLVLPVAATVGWLVSRIRSVRIRTLVAFVSVGVVVAGGILGGPSPRILDQSRVRGHRDRRSRWRSPHAVRAPSWAGACGPRWTNLAFVGALFVRALPVVLLTVLVFFNTYVWPMASTDQQAPAVAGSAVPRPHRGRVHHLGDSGPGATDVVGIPPLRGRRRAPGRHAVRDDARPRVGRSVVPARTRQRGVRGWPHRRCFRSGWWPSSPG